MLPTSLVYAQNETLTDAILRTNRATSIESNGKLSLTFKTEGLSKQDEEDFSIISGILNNLQVSFNSKLSGNSGMTISKQYVKMSANVGGSPYSGELWNDINLTGKIPVVKGIVKSPQLFEMMLEPQDMNKYMLIDYEQMQKNPEMQTELGSMDFGKTMTENKELQGAIISLIEKYSSELGINYSLITNEGSSLSIAEVLPSPDKIVYPSYPVEGDTIGSLTIPALNRKLPII